MNHVFAGNPRHAAVVLGFAESFSSPEVVWSLSDMGIASVALARKGSRTALRSSRYAVIQDVTPPEADLNGTIRDLEKLAASIGEQTAAVFLALDDVSLLVASQVRWGAGTKVIGREGAAIALDKVAQVQHAADAGFRVPEMRAITAEGEWPACVEFPVVLKPAEAVSARDGKVHKGKHRICYTQEELQLARKSAEYPLILQRYVSGTGEGIFGIAANGNVSHWSAHRRLRMMNPLGSGASACVSIQPGEREMASASAFVSAIGWNGPFMIELLRDSRGYAWFMEFNGRIWGSTALARRCGIEYPALAVRDALGILNPATNSPAKTGIVCRHAGREILHAMFVMRGRRPRLHREWPGRWKTVRDLLRLRRSEHWYNWRKDDRQVFFDDLWCTLISVFPGASRDA